MGNAKVLNNRRPHGGPPSERGGDAYWKFRIKRSIRPTRVHTKAFVCTCNCTKPSKTPKWERGKDWALTRVHLGPLKRPITCLPILPPLPGTVPLVPFPSIVQSKQRGCELLVFVFVSRLSDSSHHGCTSRSSRDLFAFYR